MGCFLWCLNRKKKEITDKQSAAASYDVPHDIVENILSRLPVKSLLRFKAVCKQWSATISDPIFARAHLQHSKNSSCSYLTTEAYMLCRSSSESLYMLRRLGLDNHRFRELSAVEFPRPALKVSIGIVSFACDGLLLIPCRYNLIAHHYVVWNPSSRTYRELVCPYPVDRGYFVRPAVCYNPLEKDYKVLVFCDAKHYALFSCTNNSWNEIKEMSDAFTSYRFSRVQSVSFKGSVYWVFRSRLDQVRWRFEIVCFDGRDEGFKNICRLDCKTSNAVLTCWLDRLYFILSYKSGVDVETEMEMETEMEIIKVQLRLNDGCANPLCLTEQNEIIFQRYCDGKPNYLLYNYRRRCFADIPTYNGCGLLIPHIENLFLL